MYSNPQELQNQIILSQIPLSQMLEALRAIVKEEIQSQAESDLQERLLSPSEACKMFQPTISKPTLTSWTNQGLLKDYRIAGRVFYRYSEILEAGKHLKRYKSEVV